MSLYDDTLVQCYYLMPLYDVLVQCPYMVALLAIPLYGGAFVLWREEKLRPKITTFVVPLRNGILRCDGLFWWPFGGAVCLVVSIALKRFDCIVLIGPDTRGSYKCGHCGWIGGKAVIRRLSRARLSWGR